MRIGDLVRLNARSLEHVYGTGIIIRRRFDQDGAPVGYQVYWSKYGMGQRIAEHSLEKISEHKEG